MADNIFLASHPAIGPMFAATDFQKQRLALRRGISMAISHAAGGGLVKRGIEQMADVHARSGRTPVDPALYPYWVDSLVKAVAETDPQFTPALERRWREGMSAVIQTFSQRH